MAANHNSYHFTGFPNLSFGRHHDPEFTIPSAGPSKPWSQDKAAQERGFQPTPGVYRLRDLVTLYSPLLDTVILRLGAPSSQAILIQGLAQLLATSRRETSLPLANPRPDPAQDPKRDELRAQAERIGVAIVEYATEAATAGAPHAEKNFALRSRCDGHLWTEEVVDLLLGPRGGSVEMQLYNEWSHRLVLLRDALLPFENFDDVPIVISETSSKVRDLEGPRKEFLMHLFSGQVAQRHLVEYAKALTAFRGSSSGDEGTGGYGFQFSQGTVLPAFLSGLESRSLLRYYPAKIDHGKDSILFEYEFPEYEVAERTELPFSVDPVSSEESVAVSKVAHAALTPHPVFGNPDGSTKLLKLELEFAAVPSQIFTIDVDQIARGRRYASHIVKSVDQDDTLASLPANAVLHLAHESLNLGGLIASASDPVRVADQDHPVHIFVVDDPIVALALLGNLYPGNVVSVQKGASWATGSSWGRGFGTRFGIVAV